MAQTQEREAPTSEPERAEEMLTHAGAQLGQWAGQALLRLRQTARALRAEAERLDLPAAERQEARSTASQETRPSLERAVEVADLLLQRMGHWTVQGNIFMKRTMARLREDAEDMWVEAEEKHKEWQEKYGQ